MLTKFFFNHYKVQISNVKNVMIVNLFKIGIIVSKISPKILN